MSKSVSETLRKQGVVLTEAPNFEQPMETVEKTKVELAMEMTNTNISKKCRKAFNKFVKKYELEIDFEKYEGKTDELLQFIEKIVDDDEEASLVRHVEAYCKSVIKNLSKIIDAVGINGAICSKSEEVVNVMDEEDAGFEKVMKQTQEEADKVTMTSKPEAKIDSVAPAAVKIPHYNKEPKMSEYIRAGKVNRYAIDLKKFYMKA